MIVFPAIDLYGGAVVRLQKGDFAKKSAYKAAPRDLAAGFRDQGCTHIHIVDLEGAAYGSPKHLHILPEIAKLGMKIEYGGGLRSEAAIRDALNAGAERAMIGSILFKTPEAPEALFAAFGEALTPSIDVKNGCVAISGWTEETDAEPAACVRALCETGFRTFLVTSVARDGMLEGPDFDLCARVACPGARIIAAGGVSTVADVQRLAEAGLYGAVVGKALYETDFDLARALLLARTGEKSTGEEEGTSAC